MKWCPKCGRSYDEDINFCLEDGTLLSSSFQSVIPQETQTTIVSGLRDSGYFGPGTKSSGLKIPIIIGSLVVVFLLFSIGVVAMIFYLTSSKGSSGGEQLASNKDRSQQFSANQNSSVDEEIKNSRLSNANILDKQERITDDESLERSDESLSSNEKGNGHIEEGSEEEVLSSNRSKLASKGQIDDLKDSEDNSSNTKKSEREEADSVEGTYVGRGTNTTFGQSFGLSIKISRGRGGVVSGRVNIAKPFLGSGKIVSGYTDGRIISFTSYDQKNDISGYWEGEIRGDLIEGTYTATTSNPYIVPNTQYGVWRVRKKK